MKRTLLVILLAIILAAPLGSLTIKLATVAPTASPWDRSLHQIKDQWHKLSDGKVNLKIYSGGIAGSEPDMIRKIRIGQLDAAAVTINGLNEISSEVFSLSVPFLIHSDEELSYVMSKTKDHFDSIFESNGFRVIVWFNAGWVYFFSRNKVVYPDDLRYQKLSVNAAQDSVVQAWRNQGFQAVPLSIPDITMGLQSGMVDAVYTPPMMAAVNQWFAIADNMSTVRLAPVVSALIVSTRTWNRIPEDTRDKLVTATETVMAQLVDEASALEQKSMEVMKRNGLKVVGTTAEAEAEWRRMANESLEWFAGRLYSSKTLREVKRHLTEFRDN